MRVSKHHYATELTRRGNRVYFLNPPDASAKDRFSVTDIAEVPGLSVVTYRPFVPFALRFRSRAMYNRVAAAHVRWLIKRLGVQFDVVWCFDVNLYADLRWFNANQRIYHPVDQVVEDFQISVAETADLVVSVSDEILQHLRKVAVAVLRVDHGLGQDFVALAERRLTRPDYSQGVPLRVGYVGNLLMRYVDRNRLRTLVHEHEELEFHFWGPRFPAESNVSGSNSNEIREFIRVLQSRPNVVLHGPLPPHELAIQLGDMDLLLMCYDVADDPNRGCNSHKILEYLSTGRVIVANHISDYAGKLGLIEMLPSLDNTQFPRLFDHTVRNVVDMNRFDRQQLRLRHALDNSYAHQIGRIESALSDVEQALFTHVERSSIDQGARIETPDAT
jgi:glycosyltransferase involved in cell wall biosynthesis